MKRKSKGNFKRAGTAATFVCVATTLTAAEGSTGSAADLSAPVTGQTNSIVGQPAVAQQQKWNIHVQNTVVVQGYPGFNAQYSGPNSLPGGGQVRETVSLDLMAGVRLWPGAQGHVDFLTWQGFGIGGTLGVEGFPNGEASHFGTSAPNVNFVRVFIRQVIGFGGEKEAIQDDELNLAGTVDINRLTITIGKLSAKDIFDNNAYANDPRRQFMNWGLMANQAWDYPADGLGFITGITFELNRRQWTERYGFFQMPSSASGVALDQHFLKAWGMVTELEHRYTFSDHPGAVRLLAYLNSAHMGSYQEAVDNFNLNPTVPADIDATAAYRYKYGFGLNWEQEVVTNVGVFMRGGWSDGQAQAWCFTDVDYGAALGLSVVGAAWRRPNDTVGIAGVFNGISNIHQQFFDDGGTGILAGDGALSYGWEKDLEVYYNFKIWRTIYGTLDYQFVTNPAFNRARGPVSVFAARLHWEF